jgi:hypothetical protein
MSDPGWVPYDPCLCGCGIVGWKLTKTLVGDTIPHVVGCNCARHRNKRNRVKGRGAQRTVHKVLGGVGFSPLHEEAGRTYSVEVQIESKKGKQIPASFSKFVGLDWTRRALQQARAGTPVGVVAFPAIYMEPEGGGQWLIVDLR